MHNLPLQLQGPQPNIQTSDTQFKEDKVLMVNDNQVIKINILFYFIFNNGYFNTVLYIGT